MCAIAVGGGLGVGAVCLFNPGLCSAAVDEFCSDVTDLFSSAQPEDNLDNFTFPGDALSPPGTCGRGQLDSLQSKKDQACNAPRRCNAQLDSCLDIMVKMSQGQQCVDARNRLNSICFKGGDKAHIREATRASKTISSCAAIAAAKNCSGF